VPSAKTQHSLQQKAGDIFILSRPTEATTRNDELHSPFTTENKAEMAEWAKPAPQQLKQLGSSAGTTSPRCTQAQAHPRCTSLQ